MLHALAMRHTSLTLANAVGWDSDERLAVSCTAGWAGLHSDKVALMRN